MQSEVHNMDCMEYMRSLPDNHFDLAIADPPYGGGQKINSTTDLETPMADLKNISVSRTGGTWAAKYAKKLSRGTLPQRKSFLMNFFVSHAIRLFGAQTTFRICRRQGVSWCGRKPIYPKILQWLCANTHGLRLIAMQRYSNKQAYAISIAANFTQRKSLLSCMLGVCVSLPTKAIKYLTP